MGKPINGKRVHEEEEKSEQANEEGAYFHSDSVHQKYAKIKQLFKNKLSKQRNGSNFYLVCRSQAQRSMLPGTCSPQRAARKLPEAAVTPLLEKSEARAAVP